MRFGVGRRTPKEGRLQHSGRVNGRRFLVGAFCIGVVPLLIIPYISTTISEQTLRSEVTDRGASSAANVSLYVDQFVVGRVQIVTADAQRDDIQAAVAGRQATQLASIAASVEGSLPGATSVLISDLDGVVLAFGAHTASPPTSLAAESWFAQSLQKRAAVVLPVTRVAGVPQLTIAVPIVAAATPKATPAGVLVVSTSLEPMQKSLQSFASAQQLSLLVTDASGNLISETGNLLDPSSVQNDPLVKGALQGTDSQHIDSSGVLHSYSAGRTASWPVLIGLPTSAALAPLNGVLAVPCGCRATGFLRM
jgi:hypothetical protein